MSLATALDRLDKKYAWSLLGFVLAAIFGALSIYTEFVRERRPQLRFEIVSDASVLDVREKLGNLEIMYDGVDIQKARLSLRVVVLRILNDGSQDILKNDFDEKAPLGFGVSGGSLLRADLLGGSNHYLNEVASLRLELPNSAFLAPLILEAGEWLTVKILVLHSDGVRPTFRPLGKVAGVREIRLVDSSASISEPGFLEQTFYGGAWVQVVRLLVYFVAFVLIFLAIVLPSVYLSGKLSARQRRRHVAQFKSYTRLSLTQADEFIFTNYVARDEFYLVALERLVDDKKRLNALMRRYEQAQAAKPKGTLPDTEAIDEHLGISSNGASPPMVWRRALAEQIVEAKFVVKDDAGWHVDPHQAETLADFARFLRIKKEG